MHIVRRPQLRTSAGPIQLGIKTFGKLRAIRKNEVSVSAWFYLIWPSSTGPPLYPGRYPQQEIDLFTHIGDDTASSVLAIFDIFATICHGVG